MSKPEFFFAGHRSSYILVGDNVLDKDVCEDLVKQCVKNYDKLFHPGPTMGGVHIETKSSMDFNFSVDVVQKNGISPEIFGAYEQMTSDALTSIISRYQAEFRELWYIPNLLDTGFRVQHYTKNLGYYREHVDGSIWGPVSARNRVFGAVIYLNDVEVGGETAFPIQEQSVEARAGRVVLFPAAWTHPHMGMPSQSGDKWIVSSFIMCYPEDVLEYDQDTGDMVKGKIFKEEEE